MKKLYVIDASGYLYRSYFAIRNVTNAKGESTNALFGFIRSIQKLRKDFNPEYLVAVFDGPSSIQKREQIYSDYKAHRVATPPDLAYQINWARQVCELAGIPLLSITGVEADDTMGSIAVWAAENEFHTYLCTSDKDLCQLVNDQISILNTFKENQILTPKEVLENFGVNPTQMVDYLAITGDSSDNVPGLPGFGPKTAAALIKEHGSLDYILRHPEVVSGKKREILISQASQALLSRQLVTIHADVDFPKEVSFFQLKSFDKEKLREFYASMNFNSLIRELEQETSAKKTEEIAEKAEHQLYQLVDHESDLDSLVNLLSQQTNICISVKGTHEQPIKAELCGLAFSIIPGQAWYVPANGQLGLKTVLKQLTPLFTNPAIGFCGHNIKYDYQVLQNYGIKIESISFDTMLASYILSSHLRQHSLDYLMLEHLGKTKQLLSDLLGKGKNSISISEIPCDTFSLYCCEEVDYIARLQALLSSHLQQRQLAFLLDDLELPLLKVLADMERTGIYLDQSYLQQMSKEVLAKLSSLESEIYQMADATFNLNSPKQLSEILFVKLGISPPKKTATGLSTNADVLEFLKDKYPICGKILEYRVLEKLRSTYIDSLPFEVYPKTERIHCTFNQTVAATGRLSCQDPNLQNIPIRSEIGRKIRTAFRPQKEGWSYLAADYSQIELRLLAHFSEDEKLIQAFSEGKDIHKQTASIIFNVPLDQVTKEQRYQAKAVNFGIIYGQQAFGLSQELGISVKEAAIFIDTYFKQFPKVKAFIDKCIDNARMHGKSITYTGRERLIPEIHSKNIQIRNLAERLAVNTPLQGTAADLIKLAMLEIHRQIHLQQVQADMILQIHDELVFEVLDSEMMRLKILVNKAMREVFQLAVPLDVDIIIGKNWAEC